MKQKHHFYSLVFKSTFLEGADELMNGAGSCLCDLMNVKAVLENDLKGIMITSDHKSKT